MLSDFVECCQNPRAWIRTPLFDQIVMVAAGVSKSFFCRRKFYQGHWHLYFLRTVCQRCVFVFRFAGKEIFWASKTSTSMSQLPPVYAFRNTCFLFRKSKVPCQSRCRYFPSPSQSRLTGQIAGTSLPSARHRKHVLQNQGDRTIQQILVHVVHSLADIKLKLKSCVCSIF